MRAVVGGAASGAWGIASVARLSEREIGIVACGTIPVVVVEGAGPVVAPFPAVIASATTRRTVVEPPLVTGGLTSARTRRFASVAHGSAGKVGVVARWTVPVVVLEVVLAATTSVLPPSVTTVSIKTLASIVASVVAGSPPSAIVTRTAVRALTITVPFLALFLRTNRNGLAHQVVDVEGAVDVGHMGQRLLGRADDAVHLSDVGAIVAEHDDGVEGRGRPIKSHHQTAFMRGGLHGPGEHGFPRAAVAFWLCRFIPRRSAEAPRQRQGKRARGGWRGTEGCPHRSQAQAREHRLARR